MGEANSIRVEVGTRDAGSAQASRNTAHRQVTLDGLVNWIKSQGYDEAVTAALVEKARRYPSGGYRHFYKNLRTHAIKEQCGSET